MTRPSISCFIVTSELFLVGNIASQRIRFLSELAKSTHKQRKLYMPASECGRLRQAVEELRSALMRRDPSQKTADVMGPWAKVMLPLVHILSSRRLMVCQRTGAGAEFLQGESIVGNGIEFMDLFRLAKNHHSNYCRGTEGADSKAVSEKMRGHKANGPGEVVGSVAADLCALPEKEGPAAQGGASVSCEGVCVVSPQLSNSIGPLATIRRSLRMATGRQSPTGIFWRNPDGSEETDWLERGAQGDPTFLV